jgi:hypothetical protein
MGRVVDGPLVEEFHAGNSMARYLPQAESDLGGGREQQVASLGGSDASAYASPEAPAVPSVSAVAGSTIPRADGGGSTPKGAVGGAPPAMAPQQWAANGPAWAGINSALPVGPSGAPAPPPGAPTPQALAAPAQGSVVSLVSGVVSDPQMAARVAGNVARVLKVDPGAPLTPELADRAKRIVQGYAQRTGQQQPQGGQGQPQDGQPLVPQIRLLNGIKDPMEAIQAINQDINRYAKFTSGQYGEVAREKIHNLEWQRNQILEQSRPKEVRPGETFLDPRTGQTIYQGTTGTLSPAAIDTAAETYYQSGKLPPNLGRGQQGPANIAAIIDRAAALHPDEPPESWAERQQAFNANAAGERTISTRSAAFTAAENAAASVIPASAGRFQGGQSDAISVSQQNH